MSALKDAIAMLGCFSLAEPSLSQTELARRSGCAKATASRVMKVLRQNGILDFDPVTRLYTPGVRLFELGQICRSNDNFLYLVNAELEEVCAVGGHTAYLTVFDGQQLVSLRMVRGSSPLAITSSTGGRSWPHATANGRAMLALLNEEEWKQRVPDELPFVTSRAPQTHQELLERIRIIRETGRSHSTDNSYDGVSAEGIAFRDPNTSEVIGVAISYPTMMSSLELQDKISGLLAKMKAKLIRRS